MRDAPVYPLVPSVRYSPDKRGWHEELRSSAQTTSSTQFAQISPDRASILSLQTGPTHPLAPDAPPIPFTLEQRVDGGVATRNLFLPPWGIAVPVSGGTRAIVSVFPPAKACDVTSIVTEGAPLIESVPQRVTLVTTFAVTGTFLAIPVDFARTVTLFAFGAGVTATILPAGDALVLPAGVPVPNLVASLVFLSLTSVGSVSVDIIWGVLSP